MAEHCLDCFNKLNDTAYNKKVVSLAEDFCEGCGEVKLCVIALRPESYLYRIIKHLRDKRKPK